MLIPPPEADLNDSQLVLAAGILGFLRSQEEPLVIEEVMLDFLKQYPKTAADDFMDSLSLLFALGLIEYENFRIRRKQP